MYPGGADTPGGVGICIPIPDEDFLGIHLFKVICIRKGVARFIFFWLSRVKRTRATPLNSAFYFVFYCVEMSILGGELRVVISTFHTPGKYRV